MDPAGQHFAVGGADALVTLWDLKNLVCLHTSDRLQEAVRTVAFSHDGRYLAAGSQDSHIDFMDVATGKCASRLAVSCVINSLAWHPSRMLLA